MASSFATRFSVAADVEVMWHHLGATNLGTELGAKICGTEFGAVDLNCCVKKIWLTNYINKSTL